MGVCGSAHEITVGTRLEVWTLPLDGEDAHRFHKQFTDPEPLAGENRYYLRVEQWDGNMAWASPVWIDFRG